MAKNKKKWKDPDGIIRELITNFLSNNKTPKGVQKKLLKVYKKLKIENHDNT